MMIFAAGNPIGAFKRYRTGKGFGVHSPFAFYFILKVLREKSEYYSYPTITAACRKQNSCLKAKYAKLLFRIINYFNPQRITLSGSGCEIAAICAKCVSRRITVADRCDSESSFIIVGDTRAIPDEEPLHELVRSTERDGTVMVFQRISDNRVLWDSIILSMKFGISFSNGKFGVIICRKKLPLKHYRVWL